MRSKAKQVVISMLILAVIAAFLVTLSWRDENDSSNKGTVEVLDAITKSSAVMVRDARALAGEAGRPEAPKFRLVTLAGDAYSQESLKGQPALLMFWAPWCQVCQRELPILGQFYLKAKPALLRVLAIGFADTRGHVEGYVKANPSTFVFPTAYDAEDRVAQDFGVNATPTFVLLDAQGHIRLVHRGGGISQNPQYQAFLASLK